MINLLQENKIRIGQ